MQKLKVLLKGGQERKTRGREVEIVTDLGYQRLPVCSTIRNTYKKQLSMLQLK